MRKRDVRSGLVVLVIFITLTGCTVKANLLTGLTLPIGSLWKAPVLGSAISWDTASPAVIEQHSGYLLAQQAVTEVKLDDREYSEGSQQDDIQMNLRKMAETDHIFAMVGASTDASTMRAASLVNFFNIPMIIPSATGDNLLPATNQWAFRLSAPGSAYAAYMFGTLIKSPQVSTPVATPAPGAPSVLNNGLRLAIFYEENTFGESAAVASARAAMKQAMNIVLYRSYTPDNPEQAKIQDLADTAKQDDAQVVYLISSDPSTALMLTAAFQAKTGYYPLIIGQGSGFASQVFLSSSQSEGVYVLRQKLDSSSCPADITATDQAQNYAAVYLLGQAVQQAGLSMPKPWWNVLPSQALDSTQLKLAREKVRDAIKTFTADLPCMGKVAFDNTGQNKLLQFELVTIQNRMVKPVSIASFQQALPQISPN